ncbi:helix-turn-helix domain-containing protein [Flavobacterium sp.]|uniref:helix-turn-helix domain-containing protein n=1 Tax=Flavobacterium sp. TaxID=239 RepID=UPI0039E450B2
MGANTFNFNIYNSIILAGIIQGLVFGAVVVFSKKYRQTSTLLLAALIVLFSLNNLQYYLTSTWLIKASWSYTHLWTPGQLFMGPLLYFYGLKVLHPEKPIAQTTIVGLSAPFVLGLIAVNWFKFFVDYRQNQYTYLLLEAIIEFASIILTTLLVGRLLWMTRKAELEAVFESTKVLPKLQWFRNTLIAFFILCFIWLYVTILMVADDAPQSIWYTIWIALSVMIYWIGHIGIYKYGIEEERKKIRHFSIEHKTLYQPEKRKNEHIAALEKLLVDEKRFLDATLTLDKIADELRLSKSHLSRIINTELQMGFPDYLNALRVEEAKSYLTNPEFANYTLLAIGLEAGFNSKTTFNTTFKKATSLTPSEYRKSATK